jgi:hypothetical protein
MNEAEEVLELVLMSGNQATEVLQPGEQALNAPPATVTT